MEEYPEVLTSEEAIGFISQIEEVEDVYLCSFRYDKTIIPMWLNKTSNNVYPVFSKQLFLFDKEKPEFLGLSNNHDMFVVDTQAYIVEISYGQTQIKKTIVELDYQALAIAAFQGLSLDKPFFISIIKIDIQNTWYPLWLIMDENSQSYKIPVFQSPTKSLSLSSNKHQDFNNGEYIISDKYICQLNIDDEGNYFIDCGYYNIFQPKITMLC